MKGADFPVVLNMFGSERRIEAALGRHPQEIGQELLQLVQKLNPPHAPDPLERARPARSAPAS